MNLLKGFKKETIEVLAELWEDPKFQKLVEVLRINQDNCAKACLTRTSMEAILRLQEEARAYSIVIKMVEDAYRKANNLPKKRRK